MNSFLEEEVLRIKDRMYADNLHIDFIMDIEKVFEKCLLEVDELKKLRDELWEEIGELTDAVNAQDENDGRCTQAEDFDTIIRRLT